MIKWQYSINISISNTIHSLINLDLKFKHNITPVICQGLGRVVSNSTPTFRHIDYTRTFLMIVTGAFYNILPSLWGKGGYVFIYV